MSTRESGSGSMSPTARQTAAMLHSSGGGRRARVSWESSSKSSKFGEFGSVELSRKVVLISELALVGT